MFGKSPNAATNTAANTQTGKNDVMATETTTPLAVVRMNEMAGNVGTPGAPVLYLYLVRDTESGYVSGHAVQTQALQAPWNRIVINNITGMLRSTGFGKYTQVLSLSGSAVVSLPPPAIGSFTLPFSAHFALEANGTGTGGWTLGANQVNNVPIRPALDDAN